MKANSKKINFVAQVKFMKQMVASSKVYLKMEKRMEKVLILIKKANRPRKIGHFDQKVKLKKLYLDKLN